jgi:50S ribosomal protein L16 3-hydroxylase
MREVWQRRPAVIRNALPDWHAPVDRDRLFQLARQAETESRMISHANGSWTLRHGPFPRLPAHRKHNWTLLVQGVDLLDERAHALLARFRFVSDARLDDLMASYATDGGGVGPHVDSYDVFLLQASGQRRWRISRQRDLRLRDDVPLRLLADFRPSAEWVLDPGDLLYLPPGVAHEGTAVGECVTYSIGFRAPSFQELVEPWASDWAGTRALRGRYVDPGIPPTAQPGALRAEMTSQIHTALTRRRPSRGDTERFLLTFLTEPKARVTFSRPARIISEDAFARRATLQGVRLHRASRMLYARSAMAINGEYHALPPAAGDALRRLADHRELAAGALHTASDALVTLLHDWYDAGWLAFRQKTGTAR